MNTKYQNQDHELITLNIPNAPIRALRYAPIGLVLVEDLATASGCLEELITRMAGTLTVTEIPRRDIANLRQIHGTAAFIPVSTAFNILLSCHGDSGMAAALRIWANNELTGNPALIAAGMTVGARLLHQTLGVAEDFEEWVKKASTQYPDDTSGTGFQEENDPDGDFPIPLNLAQLLAEGTGIFAGLVIATVVSSCGFYHRSYLRESFVEVLEDYRGVIPSMNGGLVDARHARRILGEGSSFDHWLQSLTADYPMRWGLDYFSESPIPKWNWSETTPPTRIQGPVLFTASLIEEIAAAPVYDTEYCDFDVHFKQMESALPNLAQLHAAAKVMASENGEATYATPTH